MFPTLFEFAGIPVDTHSTFIALGLLAATLLLVHESRRRSKFDRNMALIVLGALVGAAVTSRLGTGIRYLATTPEPTATGLLVEAGRSLLGGLVGAYVGVEVTKKLIGVTESTGDLFAPGVALGLAIGRIGCFLSEQLGTPTSLPWGVTMNQTGIERGLLCLDCGQCPTCAPATTFHPSFLYEVVFHAVAFVVLWRMRDNDRWRGQLLARYLVAYAAFRFLIEFVRGNVEFLFGLTGSQIFIIGTTTVTVGMLVSRRLKQTAPAEDRQATKPLAAQTPIEEGIR